MKSCYFPNKLEIHPSENIADLTRLDALLAELGTLCVRLQHNEKDGGDPLPYPPGRSPLALAQSMLFGRRRLDALFSPGLFVDPAFDILIDLFVNHEQGRAVTVSDACIAARVPPTTGLRWISALVKEGRIVRRPDATDKRRIYIELATATYELLKQWLMEYSSSTEISTIPVAPAGFPKGR